MNIYREISQKLIRLIAIMLIIALIIGVSIYVTNGKINFFIIILGFIDIGLLVAALYEYQAIKDQRIEDLKKFAELRKYIFTENPDDNIVLEFKDFSNTRKILMPPYMHSTKNLLVPSDSSNQKKPLIITIATTVSSGDTRTIYNTQVYKYKTGTNIPKFYLAGGYSFSLSHIFSYRSFYKSVKDLEEVNISKFNFPKNSYKLFSSDPNISKFFTKDFIDLLNIGLKKKKETLYIESNGQDIIFYVMFKRHSLTGMDFFINLFNVLIESLKIQDINEK